MKLRTLVEAVLPSLVDDLEGYIDYELSLVATKPSSNDPLASSIIYIKRNGEEYTVTSNEVQILERPGQS